MEIISLTIHHEHEGKKENTEIKRHENKENKHCT
jgi:hypothetical protein